MKTTCSVLVFSLLFSLFSKAQWKFPIKDNYGNSLNYGINGPGPKITITLSADDQTKSISPYNFIPNDPLGYLVYLEYATTVNVTALIKKDSLSNYRYSIFENDSTTVQSNVRFRKVDFTWPNHSDHPGCLTVNFGISDVRNKKITIKSKTDPEHPGRETIDCLKRRAQAIGRLPVDGKTSFQFQL